MFTGQPIGYSRDVDAEVDDPPGQPAQPADERNGLRALFGRAPSDDAAERVDPGTATATSPTAGQGGGAGSRKSARAVRSLRKGPGLLAGTRAGTGAGTEAEPQMSEAQAAEAQPTGVEPTDPVTYAVVLLMMLSTAALACWIPARRAIRIDPMTSLRQE